MRVIFIKNADVELIMNDNDFDYYDRIVDNPSDEEAISYLMERYSKYFVVIEIPSNATDYHIIDAEVYRNVTAIVDNKIVILYEERIYY